MVDSDSLRPSHKPHETLVAANAQTGKEILQTAKAQNRWSAHKRSISSSRIGHAVRYLPPGDIAVPTPFSPDIFSQASGDFNRSSRQRQYPVQPEYQFRDQSITTPALAVEIFWKVTGSTALPDGSSIASAIAVTGCRYALAISAASVWHPSALCSARISCRVTAYRRVTFSKQINVAHDQPDAIRLTNLAVSPNRFTTV